MGQLGLTGKVQTVLGPVDGAELGITSCHEHVLWDMSVYFQDPGPASEKGLAHQPVGSENLWWVRANPNKNVDNMVQTDESLAIKEVLRFKHAGGGTIVDLSQNGLSRDPSGLARVARASGLNIVMGSGYYIAESHPKRMDELTEDDIAEELVREITLGVGETGVRPGIIGEIGCSTPFVPNEEKVLRGCALAQQETGAPMNIHPSIGDDEVLKNVRVLAEAGADLTHVAVSHIDGFGFNQSTVSKLLDAGCYVEYDGFGQALYHFPYMGRTLNLLSDLGRVREIKRLIAAGFAEQVLVAQDFCFKCCLAEYGGYGYDHLLRGLRELMLSEGVSSEELEVLLVHNPRRFLQFS